MRSTIPWVRLVVCVVIVTAQLRAADAADAWLRYARLDPKAAETYSEFPVRAVVVGDSLFLRTAQQELVRGVGKMLGRRLSSAKGLPTRSSVVLGTFADLRRWNSELVPANAVPPGSFWLKRCRFRGVAYVVVAGADDRGVLYGVFRLLSLMARGERLAAIDELQQPAAPIRWVNQWDNLDGSIERGYGGRSIFFSDGNVRSDLSRAGEYGRLLASVGINGCAVNNVNAPPRVLDRAFVVQLRRIADALRPWGVRLSLSVDLTSPKAIGGLETFDPLDPGVAEWWRKKAAEIYAQIPDFGGFIVKADSEGRAGPSAYGRTHADAANLLARALQPHGGVVLYRAFVYNHHLDWRDLKNDRAKAAYDNFHPLDGQFEDNVIVQIKNGPIDFQVREPASPLFAGLRRTNQAIELQITQEYTGQQRHLCFLLPMWKEVLDFDMRVENASTPVREIVAGRVFHRPIGGFVGVANVGMDDTWLGNPLALANLYGFGRLAWDPTLPAESIIDEWTHLTFGTDPLVTRTVEAMQLSSWRTYEKYTGFLGVGTLTDILGNHLDPAPESSERNGWGQWHRADHDGIGMDRTVATGTGYTGQYPPQVQKLYESLADCPDELLLFFHHVPYTYKLRSGKTLVQHVYDSHFEGAEEAREYIGQWKQIRGHIDEGRYEYVLTRLEFQAQEAARWRKTICQWIYRLSAIPDEKGRDFSRP
jgi:alpha-glucuronidase